VSGLERPLIDALSWWNDLQSSVPDSKGRTAATAA